jgi:hypothetical protein
VRGRSISRAGAHWDGERMHHLSWIHWETMQAERAFDRAARGRRLARRRSGLAVHDPTGAAPGRVREIRLDEIVGTLEPSRAAEFDGEFRPIRRVRGRWLAVWLAETRGTGLPPISVARVAGGYAVRDGHHRVSVARARGAVTITASVG